MVEHNRISLKICFSTIIICRLRASVRIEHGHKNFLMGVDLMIAITSKFITFTRHNI